jgi:hypothetical protein
MKSTRRHLTYANVAATLALVFAMSGGALAANHYLITSTKQIKPSVLKKLKGAKGTKGATGSRGPAGAAGPTGSVDSSKFFTKTESDARFLGKGEQAVDSAKLGGVAASGYTTGSGQQGSRFQVLSNGETETDWLIVPGVGPLGVKCQVTPTPATTISLTEGEDATFVLWNSIPNKATPQQENFVLKSTNPEFSRSFTGAEDGSGEVDIQAANQPGSSKATLANITVSAAVTEGECWFQANYVASHPGS